MNKKAQSQIITTVLIILLVLAAIVIVWQVIQGFVKKGTEDIKNNVACINAIDVLEIDKSSCYRDLGGNWEIDLIVKKNLKDVELTGFIIIVTSKESSENFKIKNNNLPGEVTMIDNPMINLEIPLQGESKSYRITTTISNIKHLEIASIINEKICTPSEKVNINLCQ